MYNAIKALFPTAIPGEDFKLRDDSNGVGPYIFYWNTAKLGTQPTPAAIAAATVTTEATAATDLIRTQAIDASIVGDTTIASLKAMTNAEFDVWWAANVTTLVQAGGVLKRLARVILRRLL